MKNRILCLSLSMLAALTFLAVPVSAQDAENATPVAAAPVSEQVAATMAGEELSIYGEVQSVDAQGSGSITVQYYDYDSDNEKTITIALDANTKIENASSIADIKKGDWADVSYSNIGDKSMAKSIIVEKEEEAAAAGPVASEQAVMKEEAQTSGDLPY